MAFAARLGALTEELVEAVTGLSAETRPERFAFVCDAALRNLRSQSYLRTNQFEVKKTLDGLEERFRINNRDDLADEFRESLDKLEEQPSKWHPEILSLFLQLSDQPTFKTKLSTLNTLREDELAREPPLRWEDIAREDGWDEDELLWRSINYSDGSDDEMYVGNSSDDSNESSLFGDLDEPRGRTAADCIVKPEDTALLNSIQKAQEWRTKTLSKDEHGNLHKVSVTEPHLIREILFMLQGLETSIFNHATGLPMPTFQMEHVAWETYKAVVLTMAESGRRITLLRRFVGHPQAIPHLQAFQDCISKRLRDFDNKLSQVEARFAAPKEEPIFSLLVLNGEITPWLEPFVALANIITQVQETPKSDTFRYLELLYDETTMAQLKGDLSTYEFLARIFMECFNVYLRPIRHWMDEGRLLPGNEIFFISESLHEVPLSRVWQDRFELRKTSDGGLHVPKFLNPAVNQIYNAGKNIVVLRLLGKYDTATLQDENEPPLDYESVCPEGLDLATFPDLFATAFDKWIQSKYRKTSTTLKDALFETCGLSSTLDALQALYLMSDGFAASSFSEHLFDKLENLNPVWYDRFALTGAGQDAFMSLVDTSRLSVSVDIQGQRMMVSEARGSVRPALPHVKIDYRLAWSIQIVVSEDSMVYYQSIFALLLQLRRAVHVLHKPRILENYWTDHENWDERALFYAARRNLLWFCTTIQTYLSTLVLEPNRLRMRHDLKVAQDVDSMISIHTTCMKEIVSQACLGNRLSPIRECMLDILDLALKLEQAREAKIASGTAYMWKQESDSDADGYESREKRPTSGEAYMHALEEVNADFDRHLRFICSGLRSVARATSDAQSAKWDILADMLQTGDRDR